MRKEERGDQLVSMGKVRRKGEIGSGWSLSLKGTEYPGHLLCDLESLHFKVFPSWLIHIPGMQDEMGVRNTSPNPFAAYTLIENVFWG